MVEGELAVYYDNANFILGTHVTFTQSILNKTFGQNYLNSLCYKYIYSSIESEIP
jgi:hypothetical protein